VDMPDYAYEYCKEMITKSNKTKPKNTTDKTINKSIVNYDDRQIYEFFDLTVMNAIYKIRYENGDMNNYDTWLKSYG